MNKLLLSSTNTLNTVAKKISDVVNNKNNVSCRAMFRLTVKSRDSLVIFEGN